MARSIIIAAILSSLCAASPACAQTFLQRLQTPKKYQGTVSVTQSADIDRLVNGASANFATTSSSDNASKTSSATTSTPVAASSSPTTNDDETVTPDDITYDNRKKVMRNSYKTDGYRVQAFAGGNTKKDKINAEKAGNQIKQQLPDQPVYVHFYSPRWICRVGNFRSYEEAHQVLLIIREMGFKQASIVKGKITVQY